MAKPRQQPERELLRLRPNPELAQGIERLARELRTSTEGAALFALRVGLTFLPIARMSVGVGHAIVPCECGTVLAFSVGPGDAEKITRVLALLGEQ